MIAFRKKVIREYLLRADCVDLVAFGSRGGCASISRSGHAVGLLRPDQAIAIAGDLSLASFLTFWAVASRWNSSRAPFGPRNRNLPSCRMHLRWANSISIFFRSRREVR
jgi:hypothetical protein